MTWLFGVLLVGGFVVGGLSVVDDDHRLDPHAGTENRTAQAVAAVFAISTATIVAAWGFELAGYLPCPLCLQQRWAYYAVVPLSGLLLALILADPGRGGLVRRGLLLVALIMTAGAILGPIMPASNGSGGRARRPAPSAAACRAACRTSTRPAPSAATRRSGASSGCRSPAGTSSSRWWWRAGAVGRKAPAEPAHGSSSASQ
jgi:disulfide bond formation protein DsbB